MMESRKKWLLVLFGVLTTMVFGANIAVVVWRGETRKSVNFTSNVPRLMVELSAVSIEEINAGSKDLVYADNTVQIMTKVASAVYDGVEIKGRGNSTWGQEKRPYQIKFKQKVDLLGMGAAKKWVLLANYYDASNLRTDVAFYLERLLGEPYALRGEFVELVVDGEDLGLYYLTPKVEIGKTRIDLRDPLGVLVELDNLHKEEEHYLVDGSYLQLKDIVTKDLAAVAMDDFAKSWSSAVRAAKEHDLTKMAEVVDLDSMVRYYLLSEFTVNPDAYASSFFMYKDGEDDIIHLGPGWDFDFSMGNKEWIWSDNEEFYAPFEMNLVDYYDSERAWRVPWIPNTTEFSELVGKLYRERLMGRKDEVMAYLDERAKAIWQEAIHSGEKWEMDFVAELKYLKEWLAGRFDFFDEFYGGLGELNKLML